MPPTVACVVGTRPEAIKMAPVLCRLGRTSDVTVRLVSTGQHRGLLDHALADFGLTPDFDLDLMRPGQGLADLAARALAGLAGLLATLRPALVLAQGDTTTVLAAALAAYYARIPFGHIEAGLRSGRPDSPFPEETNRVLISRLATLHFAPTPAAARNLRPEGIDARDIHITGNPVVDALRMMEPQLPPPPPCARGRYVLATIHRRENHGAPLDRIAAALRTLLGRHEDLSLILPLHPNPSVSNRLRAALEGEPRAHLIDPLGYREFLATLRGAALVLSDSGGVQEEGPALGRRVLVLRETTERPEAVAAGFARVVGTDPRRIVAEAERSLLAGDPPTASGATPFGDGRAAERIVRIVLGHLGVDPGPAPRGLDSWPPRRRSRRPALLSGQAAR
jgi:UDP-N-acetylglucosamine 2-epimerase (non-hydrolysing)